MLMTSILGGFPLITIRRPEARNALNVADKQDLIRQLHDAAASGARCIILTGDGDQAFCAGTDVKEMSRFAPVDATRMLTVERDVCDAIISLDVPVIAAINGVAAGAGCVLAYSVDISVAADDARFGQPEVKHGVPAGLHVALLPQVVGLARARKMLLTAEFISAEEAVSCGLINESVPREKLMDRVLEIANRIASLPEQAIRLQKRANEAYVRQPLDAAIDSTIYMGASAFTSDVPRESIRSWVEGH